MLAEETSVLIRSALFADETIDYRIPEEPDAGDKVCLRFRTAKNHETEVFYIEEGKTEAKMSKVSTDTLFDYYEYHVTVNIKVKRYYFKVQCGNEVCYYHRLGAVDEYQPGYSFCITPGFHTPEWAKGAVMYQIYVDRFCNGDVTNDVETDEYIYIGTPVQKVTPWEKMPDTMDVGHFYGGDLQGVWDKLDYLQYLGIEVIYFNPLFVSPSNHKYDCQDYDHIDPHFGVIVTDEGDLLRPRDFNNQNATKYQTRSAHPANLEASDKFFASFMEEVHKRGMRVIIDGVFNHCGSFNKWLDKELIYKNQGSYEDGAYVSKESPYHTFFSFDKDGKWPCNHLYAGWWGHDTLPKLNYEDSPKLYQYILDVAKKWVSPPYNVDGWRLDVAADLGHSSEYNHQFWRDFRRVVKEANPEAIVLAEHYGDPSSWLAGDQWDTIMNYDAFMEPLTWFLTGMQKHSDEYQEHLYGDGERFFSSMKYFMSRLQGQSVMVAMNQLSNHDHSRFLTRTNHQVGRLATVGSVAASEGINYGIYRQAVMMQMTWPGAPTLYYGDETGVCGWTDPDNRRTYPWGRENFELIEYHRYIIELHKHYPALRRGSMKPLLAKHQLIAYGRMAGDNICVIVLNNLEKTRQVEIPVWELGITDQQTLKRVMLSLEHGYNVGQKIYPVVNGTLSIELPAYSSVILSVV